MHQIWRNEQFMTDIWLPVAKTRSSESVPRRDVEQPSQEWRRTCGRPSTTWVHQICRDSGVSATEALLLAEDKPFWRTIATAGGSGLSLRTPMMMMLWLAESNHTAFGHF